MLSPLTEESERCEETRDADPRPALSHPPLARIECRPGLPYFVTSTGEAWTPIGHNDAIDWPELKGLFRRRDIEGVRRHLQDLRDRGVTCIRLMLEYAQGRHRFLERPAGTFARNMVQLWDDLFRLCEETGMRLLVTPFDTFFTWRHWRHHPYNRVNGGPTADRRQLITCPQTRDAIKRRFEFATRRWGASPALFAWDLWNELHPAHGGDDPAACIDFVSDISRFLRDLEQRVHGRGNLQTVSVFGPELLRSPALCEPVFRHPGLDFVNTHLYEKDTIDNPRDTVAPAIAAGRLMREALAETRDQRPVFDSEHGPIHSFIDLHRTLPEPFDDEYFRHIQWAHLASGGAGGGMRWPNRHPHVLTRGMRRAQKALADFLPLVDWTGFGRRNLNQEGEVFAAGAYFAVFACGDETQAIAWLLRSGRESLAPGGMLRSELAPVQVSIALPGLCAGRYRVTRFDTREGRILEATEHAHPGGRLSIEVGAVGRDIAIALRRLPAAS
ncbi:conserved hypothetical protein [Burkholderiales bacterium 8X]|nr:conserved hypothetical protein [Burkholderiales bacterium 8X]